MPHAFPALLHAFRIWRWPRTFADVQFRSFHFIYGLKSLE